MPVTWRDLVRQIEMYCLRFEMDGSLRAPYGGPRSMDSLRIPARIRRRRPACRRGARGVRPPVPLGRSLPVTLHQQYAGGARGDAAVRQVPDFRRLDPTAATPEAGPSRRPAVCGDDSWGRGRAVGHGGAPFGRCGAGHASGQRFACLFESVKRLADVTLSNLRVHPQPGARSWAPKMARSSLRFGLSRCATAYAQ